MGSSPFPVKRLLFLCIFLVATPFDLVSLDPLHRFRRNPFRSCLHDLPLQLQDYLVLPGI